MLTVSEARAAALTVAGQPIPPRVPILALIDTGASCTCVDPSVLTSLGLTATGSVSIKTPSTGVGTHSTLQYDVGFRIPPQTRGDSALAFPAIAVVAVDILPAHGYHALIGRDILAHCILIYNGVTGFFSLSY